MNRRGILSIFLLLAIAVILLTACSTDNVDFVRPSTPVEPADDASLGVKIKWWLTEVAWSAVSVPIIGPLVSGVLGEMKPENHWIIGGLLILFTLGLFRGRTPAL
jgi:hypothetical protein